MLLNFCNPCYYIHSVPLLMCVLNLYNCIRLLVPNMQQSDEFLVYFVSLIAQWLR